MISKHIKVLNFNSHCHLFKMDCPQGFEIEKKIVLARSKLKRFRLCLSHIFKKILINKNS